MTILTSLAEFYERLAARGDAPPRGYSLERISFEMVISDDGDPIALNDLRDPSEARPRPREIAVPKPIGARASGIMPFFLWDKTAYSLGVIAENSLAGTRPGQGKRTQEEHAAFVALHEDALAEIADAGLAAFLSFLRKWRPEDFSARGFPLDALDQNIVFRLDGERRFLHDRPAAKQIWARLSMEKGEQGVCLVTGSRRPLARLHPSLRGVTGTQSSGAALVSFNLPAFDSYGKSQGANAPVSAAAASAYGLALSWLLNRGNGRAIRVGDATVVFWADAKETGEEAAAASENLLAALFGGASETEEDDPDKADAPRILSALEKIAAGRPLPEIDARLNPQTRVHILGLAPNNARLVVRFWHVDDFGPLTSRIARHWRDLRIEPAPWKAPPAAWALLYETALQRKAENIPPRLGGELMRAILTGQPYPRTLLAAVIKRVRADGEISGRRAAIAKAVLARLEREEDIPVALDRDNPNPAYRLGRLFALIESAQMVALPGLKATVKDRYFAAACATPARVFPLLHKNAMHHLANIRKGERAGLAHWMEREIGEIWSKLTDELPRSLRLEDQARFIAGYYHQRYSRKADDEAPNGALTEPTEG